MNNKIILILLALIFYFSTVAQAHDSCSQAFHLVIHTEAVGAKKIENGISAMTLKKTPLYLTDHFITKLDRENRGSLKNELLNSKNITSTEIATYDYDQNEQEGSGRDYLIPEGKSVKGAGTNKKYSNRNSFYEFHHYQKNGVQAYDSGLIEFATAKNFERLGVPVVEYQDWILFPDQIQKYFHRTIAFRFGKATPSVHTLNQTLRDAKAGRLSQSTQGLSPEAKTKLAASLYLHNIGHGSINAQNISSDGKLVDLGHVSFGFPFLSFSYRCTFCTLEHGSNFDRKLNNILDFLYPSEFPTRSYQNQISDSEAKAFINEIRLQLGLNPLNESRFHETPYQETLQLIFKEKLLIGNLREYQQVQALGASLLKQKTLDPETKYKPDQVSFSFRFLLQLLFLKPLLGNEIYSNTLEQVIQVFELNEEQSTLFLKALNQLAPLFIADGNPKRELLAQILYSDYLPGNLMTKRVREKIDKLWWPSAKSLAKNGKKLIQEFTTPIEYGPEGLVKVFFQKNSH